MGTTVQDSLFVALIASITAEDIRSTAVGVFDTIYGVAWLAGSAASGVLTIILSGVSSFSPSALRPVPS